MKNRKGFTLVELLAVIVILGVLLGILIPVVSNYINNSRKSGFVASAKEFADSVKHDATEGDFQQPIQKNDVTIVTLDKSAIQNKKEKSSFGGEYLYNQSYVAIINIGDGTNPEYKYFVSLQDSKNYAIPLTARDELDNDDVVVARNKMEVTIQSLCGTDEGKVEASVSNISGLQDYQPVGDNGAKMPWNVTIYSTEDCGKTND